MTSGNRNSYLQHDISDESDDDAGYDSEAAEVSKVDRATKRRKINHTSSDGESGSETEERSKAKTASVDEEVDNVDRHNNEVEDEDDHDTQSTRDDLATTERRDSPIAAFKSESESKSESKTVDSRDKKKSTKKAKGEEVPPGVVYLSSLPPYLKPSALRNLLSQRGFAPITRLFLSPASKHKSSSKKNSRQLYTEGWIEFASKKTARRCSETLNAQVIGGKKGGFYHDDVWNMKYLRGMRWEELMAGVREEKREMEGRRDEERRNIMRDTKRFVEGVEEGRRIQGMKRKKESKAPPPDHDAPTQSDVKRTWRQFDVKGDGQPERWGKGNNTRQDPISDDVKQVLGKIF
ncbi:uncharacterized protein A1O9_08201 [Exophiala aquamarina CBS 119918]|uniref:Pre-rRNA-processing protein ESF2 n=1 Tax=Exophiala aquamarina CBS 119918 TaxID=1182545 RepID=A0A072P6G0_9EURO|nr:uncharacterized protein A1O9_08201 [Exophiala aquamarina CBS 119918]KEF55451.1 hypothetical protein A1O9_08201 [Exophiala aquamarina CBS 119918]